MAEDPVDFVRSVQLSNKKATQMPLSFDQTVESKKTEEEKLAFGDQTRQGFIKRVALYSFDKGVEKSSKEDILDIFAFAQCAADDSYDREKEPENWFEVFTDVIMKIGFNIQKFYFVQYVSSGSSNPIDMKESADLLVFSEEKYGKVREEVKKKLHDIAKKRIGELPGGIGGNWIKLKTLQIWTAVCRTVRLDTLFEKTFFNTLLLV